jgi:hypothetical protein
LATRFVCFKCPWGLTITKFWYFHKLDLILKHHYIEDFKKVTINQQEQKKLFVYCPCLSWSWRNCLFIVPVYPEAEETVCLLSLSIPKLKKLFVYCSCLSWSWRNCLFIVPVYPEAEETVCLSSLSIMKYSETCLNQTFLGPTFVFVINRILVYTGKIYKDIILWDYI